jgi:RNA polymerase sigma-70 factor, ECF subfamily
MTLHDDAILNLLQAGDGEDLHQFYQATHAKLLVWMRKRVGDEADLEELVQDTYLAFVDSLPAFRGGSSLWTFLVSIARHEVADYWRKRYAKKVIKTVPFIEGVYAEKLYSAKETAMALEQAYAHLLEEERMLLVWKYEEHKPLKEIAALLGVGLRAAESRLFRARKRFQEAYALVGEV